MPPEDQIVRRKRSASRQKEGFIRHPQEMQSLVIVSAVVVVMTYSLLTRGDGGFIESNPFAGYFLDRWGMAGMAYFKASMTLLVCLITQIVARQNSKLARQVLELATLIVAVVVIYSVWLHFRHRTIPAAIESEAFLFVLQHLG